MIRKVSQSCSPQCGAQVAGEVDTDTREFIHRFRFPNGVEDLLPRTRTEVEGIRLVTFGPDSEWFVDCPVCRGKIPIPTSET